MRLDPMPAEHLPALCKVGLDERIWKWTANVVKTESDLENYVHIALAIRRCGQTRTDKKG